MKKISLLLISSAALMIGCTDYQGEIESAHEEYTSPEKIFSRENCMCVLAYNDYVMYEKGAQILWELRCGHGDYRTNFSDGTLLKYDLDIYDGPETTNPMGEYYRIDENHFYLELTKEMSNPTENVTPYIDVKYHDENVGRMVCVNKVIHGEAYYTPSSSSFTPLSSSSVGAANACGDLWCGREDTEGRVKTGFRGETSGYWYSYTDSLDGGNSKIIFPDDVAENEDGNFFGPLVEKYKGIPADIKLNSGYDFPFVGLGFNIIGEGMEGGDISAWDGLCLVYKSGKSFNIQLAVENDSKVTEYNNYSVTVPASKSLVISDFDWSRFKQADGWGKKVQLDDVLQKTASINFHFSGVGSAEFFLQSIGKYGTCK